MKSYKHWLHEAEENLFNFCVLYETPRMARVILRRGPVVDRKFWNKVIKPQLRRDGFVHSPKYAGWTRGSIRRRLFDIIVLDKR
jgi:hypothetical protein